MATTSKNYNDNFRLVTIGKRSFLVWFNYSQTMYPKSFLTVEDTSPLIIGKKIISKTYLVDIKYDGLHGKSSQYAFFNKHKAIMQKYAEKFAKLRTAK